MNLHSHVPVMVMTAVDHRESHLLYRRSEPVHFVKEWVLCTHFRRFDNYILSAILIDYCTLCVASVSAVRLRVVDGRETRTSTIKETARASKNALGADRISIVSSSSKSAREFWCWWWETPNHQSIN